MEKEGLRDPIKNRSPLFCTRTLFAASTSHLNRKDISYASCQEDTNVFNCHSRPISSLAGDRLSIVRAQSQSATVMTQPRERDRVCAVPCWRALCLFLGWGRSSMNA
ncbi:unnamed protein product [Trichogramma brassicae]|uniref:Uncharacterized protein n=1 Tax=Trichogramma brassicae TaxID=86971 RepID=A0A6H5IUG7_9HYME|nr:unnamed protein product [Trichogramma brassicae]